jgi:uncharacterized protein (DUF2147 family)
MRLAIIATALALAAGPAFAADPVEGDWWVGTTRVRIAPCPANADRLCGVIVAVKPADGRPTTDVKNPDSKLRSRPIVGMTFIRDFRRADTGRWTGGKIYDPNTGKTYDSKMRLNPDGSLKLDGCVLMICQSQTWKRAS